MSSSSQLRQRRRSSSNNSGNDNSNNDDNDETKMANDQASSSNKDCFSILTYNVGLLQLRLCCGGCGPTVFANPPFVQERLPYIPQALRRCCSVDNNVVDVLALQECYDETHFQFIAQQLEDLFPHTARVASGNALNKFHNGLAVLSKHPIRHVELQPYNKVSTLERCMATKSSLIVDIEVKNGQEVWRIVNAHTTAGGTVDPEHPGADLDRQDELRQAADALVENNSNHTMSLLVGDLNCGPEASADNYRYLIHERGFRDAFVEYHDKHDKKPRLDITWDPRNPLNAVGPHKDSPGQRCDHVLLLTNKNSGQWRVQTAEIVLDEAVVELGSSGSKNSNNNKKMVTLSDHYGLLVKLAKEKNDENDNDDKN